MTAPAWSDPEAAGILTARKRARDGEFLRNVLGEPAYLLSLQILGYLPDEAKTELNLLKMERGR
jgi:hypothetical protein